MNGILNNLITGEKFQSLCDHHLSIEEFMPYELYPSDKHIDVTKFDFDNFNNLSWVHVNNNLVDDLIPELSHIDMYDILSKFVNPFNLILHNNDASFSDYQLRYFDIPNCKKIYAQNVITYDNRVVPLPIGIANNCWEWGNLDLWKRLEIPNHKENFVYFNFTVEGGCRDVKRPSCYESISSQQIPWVENKTQFEYIKSLSTYKFCICPEGNGIDTHRLWESLYLKTVPIVDRSANTEYFSKIFPMVLVDDWKNFDVSILQDSYDNYNWDNYYLLDFNNFCREFGL